MFQSWLYLNYLSNQLPQNIQNFEQENLENKLPLDNANQTRSRRGSNQFQPIILSPVPITQKLINKQIKDGDYEPDKIESKKIKTNKQDQNRNVIPNTIHQIISYIQKKHKSGKVVQKIFQKYQHQSNWTIKRFYIYLLKLKDNISHYVNEETLIILNRFLDPQCQVFSQSQQIFYIKVCRVLIHNFLNHESATIVLTSRRMNHHKKKHHLEIRRLIQNKLKQIYRKN